jgi:membrane protease YdiL (CAAX protease family)
VDAKPRLSNYLEWSDEGRSAIWRHLVAVVVGYLGLQWGSIPLLLLVQRYMGDPTTEPIALEFTFAGMIIVVLLLVKFLLGRPSWSVALPSWPPRLADYAVGIGVWWVGMAAMYLALVIPFGRLTYRGWESYSGTALVLSLLTIVGVAIQTGAEELYFRGLFAQATRRITRLIPVVIGVQALFFAQLHAGNVKAWGGGFTAMLPYIATAVALGWAAWRSGSLMMPMGMHFANNIALYLLVSTEGDVTKLATPFVAQTPEPARAIAEAIGQAVIVIVAVELIARRRAAKNSASVEEAPA